MRLKNICIKLEKEKKKLEEDQVKEKTEILKEKLKVEDELQRAVFQNKKLQVKDETYTGIFDCLKELLKKNSELERNDVHEQSAGAANRPEPSMADVNPQKQPNENQNMLYVCTKCDFQSRRENILLEHIKIDHPPSSTKKIYACDICEFVCDSQVRFKKHCNEVHRETKYHCDYCGIKVNSMSELDNHIEMNHKKRSVQCEKCDSSFSTRINLTKHMEYKHKIFYNHQENASPEFRFKTYSNDEKAANGFCRNWNNSTCDYGDNACRFLHKESPDCRYQNRCRNISSCRFFHGQQQSQGFQYRKEDFPPPSNSNQNRSRRNSQ